VHLSAFEATRLEQTIVLVFEIMDTGIGMDSQTLSRLFQRFTQGDDSRTRKFGGAGLGLEISQSLARMMGGEISVRSVVGTGSTFTVEVRVPFHPGMNAAQSAPTAAQSNPVAPDPSVAGRDAKGDPGTQATRVLVVEDHPINQKLVAALLRRMGCNATFCENGELALDWVRREPFDMVLMDVNMPVMDGLTATRAIRAMEGEESKLPIVVLTADVMNDASGQALAAGANDFLTKPVNAEQLRAIVSKYAAKRSNVFL